MSKLAVANIIFESTESNRIEYTGNNVVRVRANGGFQLPYGTTAQRASPETGLIRYNTDTGTVETYDAAGWYTMPTGGFVNNIFGAVNAAFGVANAAYGSANNVAPQIAPAFNTANAAYAAANNVAPQVTPSYNTANLAFLNSNVAFDTANAAYAAANNITPQIAPSYNTANSAYNTANAGYASINSNWTVTNTVYGVANAAYGYANSSNTYAESTFLKLTASNQTVTGNLSVTGNFTLLGNATTISSNNLIVGDSMIYLAANNYSGTDILDIGFVANYANGTGANVHTGLLRDATNKQYYLFQGLDIELQANNTAFTPGANGVVNAVLNADLYTSNLTLGGANAINWISAGYNTANAAYNAANNVNLSAPYNTANAAYNTANAAYNAANNSSVGPAYNTANAAFAKANNALANTDGTVFNGNLRVSSTISVPLWYENDSNITSNATLTSGRNAMMAGPITLDANVTITIPSGSTLAVV